MHGRFDRPSAAAHNLAMNLQQIRYFVAVAETLSFRRASERLHISQPPLTFHIKALEEELGLCLINRTTRYVALTEAGAAFLERARQIIALVEQTSREMEDIACGMAGTLRVAFTISTSFHSFFHRIVHAYRETYPKVNLKLESLSSGVQVAALCSGELDVGLLRWPFEAVPNLMSTRLHSASLMLVVHQTHPIVAKPVVSLADLRDDPFITYPRSMGSEIGIYRQILTLCERAGFTPRIVHEVLEPSLMIGLVAAGAGVAIVPSSLACMQIPGVSYKPIDDPSAETALYLVRQANTENPRIDSFWNTALATVALDQLVG